MAKQITLWIIRRLPWWVFPLTCAVKGHDWHFAYLRNLDGSPYRFVCCMRCEKSIEEAKDKEGYAVIRQRFYRDDDENNTD